MAVGTRASEEIRKDITDQLSLDSRMSEADVEVEVMEDGSVRLSGAVPTYAARRAAQEDASSVDGVRSVDNRLYVERTEGIAGPSDEEVRDDVLGAIDTDEDLESTDVDASVSDGWVTLRGSVDAYWKKLRAESLASTQVGVRGLTNEVAVVPSGTYEDRLIAESITSALEQDAQIEAGLIDVRVLGGRVTLSGSVPSLSALQAAEATAQYTPGVIEVVNELSIV
ncbi:MAG: BON domain-containing protein [Solirubrobacterales bacterium]